MRTLTGTFTPPQRLRVACAHRAADCRAAHPRVLYFAQNEAEKRFHLRCVASGTAPTRVDAEQEEEASVCDHHQFGCFVCALCHVLRRC